ncbi:pachytene checkpoint protein 2 homolog [Galendromus occidentalis]|uniref:Pachytene checkpoint protein 2 homolog n=1 Tax=Galendromus occidentalis TaxID=34638 RepID=A0AAJ7L5I8_9ACAR|nr:pachytene checkpoint protein 2 homolog [Galendromus occidentalis]
MLIEVQLNLEGCSKSRFDAEYIKELVGSFVEERLPFERVEEFVGTKLHEVVDKIVTDDSDVSEKLKYYFYFLNNDGYGTEFVEVDSTNENAAQILTLPCSELEGIWENLHFESDVKNRLLSYASKTVLFSDMKVDQNIISLNKVILLHGPPGTGKTSLCRGIAQKLAKKFSETFEHKYFVEINAHSLFSKYFSESGKLVQQMFDKISYIASDRTALVCLLIDEVESLAHSRAAAASGNEPSDSIRVVNALLTQLDKLKSLPNVLIFTTSNVESTIDGAFVDRADLCLYIGHPSSGAISKIYASCVEELIKRKLLEKAPFGEGSDLAPIWNDCVRLSGGLSGRCLRKLPLLAYVEGDQSMKAFMESFLKLIKAKAAEKKLSQTHHMFQSISLV